MRVLLISNGYYDTFLPLAAALAKTIDCTINIQIEDRSFHQSIFDYNIKNPVYGVDVHDEDTEGIRRNINELTGTELNLVFTKYPSRSFKDWRNWRVSHRWIRWLKKQKFDVIHYNGTSMIYLQQLFLNNFGKKIFTIHDHVNHLGEEAPQVRWLYRYMVAGIKHRFIAHSDFVREGFIKEFNLQPERISTVRFGAIDLYKNWEDPFIAEEPETILFFGRISPYKGLEYLGQAWKIIRQNNPKARLIIAGEGKFYFDAENLMSDPRVEMHNRYIDNAALVTLIQRASLIVLPYVEATQSGVVMTAYAFNKPVVATRVGALPEVVEDGKSGFIVPPKNAPVLAQKILELLNDQQKRKKMSDYILLKKQKNFSWDDIALRTKEVYIKALT